MKNKAGEEWREEELVWEEEEVEEEVGAEKQEESFAETKTKT